MSEPHCVLIAEDNPGLARVLSFKFKSSGYTPVVCSDGQAAWEAFQQGDFAAVVSDQEMPRMTGVELCKNVRSLHPQMPFFLVTGRQMELKSAGVQQEHNINEIFAKPFSPATVIEAVTASLSEQSLTESTLTTL